MVLSLMVYVLAVSFLLGLAAWAFERAVRVFAFPTRWIWVGAMGGSLGYMLLAVLRPATSSQLLGTVVATPLDALLVPVVGSITRLAEASHSGINLEPLLAAGWVILTLAVAAVLLRAHLRLRSDRSTWTPSELDGRDVLVSEDLGPGVVGWIRSVIVMPRWAFGMPPEERELMLQHEGEHCNAGDTRVAGIALVLLTLLPWNLPLWWQVHRLRLAIEIDCDHRVLHRSPDVKRYATLLVEIGARGTTSRWSAMAFARPIPSIERRILAMTDTRDDPRYIRTMGLVLLAALLVVASCEVERPPNTVETEPVTVDAPRSTVIDLAERSVPIEQPPPNEDAVPPAVQGQEVSAEEMLNRVRAAFAVQEANTRVAIVELQARRAASQLEAEAIAEALAQAVPQELRPEDRAAIEAGPVFTPMTVRPEILNASEVQAALVREYPPILRDAGIGGMVVVWYYISETGQVLNARVSEGSGQAELDAASLRVAAVFQFSPAMNRDRPVSVWIPIPITFDAEN